jgi:hypothetical protein
MRLLTIVVAFTLLACTPAREQPQLPAGTRTACSVTAPTPLPDGGDGGSPADTAPEPNAVAEEEKQPAPPSEEECPHLTAAPATSWNRIHLDIVPQEPEDPGSLPWEVQVAGEDQEVFPAVSRDGKLMAQRFYEEEDFSGRGIESVAIFSTVTGKTLGLYILLEHPDGVPSEAAIKKEHARSAQAVRAANGWLDKTEWRRVETGRKPTRACPGTPWTKLDEERETRDGFRWERVTRFDREGLDFEYDGEGGRVTIRALQADGSLRAVTMPYEALPPGKTTWMADTHGLCGWSEGLYGFGARELGAFFVYGDANLGGDSCGEVLAGKRTSLLRLPRELRAGR